MSVRTFRPRRRSIGQGTVELAVAAIALVPLIVGVIGVAGVLDAIRATEQAARYVSFEAALARPGGFRKTDERLGEEVRARFLSSSEQIRSASRASAAVGTFRSRWRDMNGRLSVDRPALVRTETNEFGFIGAARRWWRDDLRLPARTRVTGSVEVDFRPGFVGASPLRIVRPVAIVSDAWTQRSLHDTRARIEGAADSVFPFGQVRPLYRVLDLLPPLLTDSKPRPGMDDWDRVPCDRLEPRC